MKTTIIAIALCLCAASQASADFKEGYYDILDGKTREALKAAAKECVEEHIRLTYSDLPVYWEETDVYPELYEDPNGNMCPRWWDMYSDNVYLIYPDQTAKKSFSAWKMQREHAVPKSWWKDAGDVEYTPAYSDLWNLYPSDGEANGKKSNYPLGEVRDASFDNGVSRVGVPVAEHGGGAGKVFEPADEYKGDFARAFFYMATVYDALPWTITYMYEQNEWPTLRDWAVDMLLDWSRRDPVSPKEADRNDAVERNQGNRNPFIDFPELAEFLWGARASQTFYLDEQDSLTPTQPGDTGVDGIYDYAGDFRIGVIEGGFTVVSDGESLNMRVYDLSGRLVMHVAAVSGGDTFMLPRGIYIVTADGCTAPSKLIVR